MSRTTIPDLRAHNNEFTLEHCSVIQERLGRTLDKLFGPGHAEIADQIDTENMHAELMSLDVSGERMAKLFEDELGKGFLVGVFYGLYIHSQLPGEE